MSLLSSFPLTSTGYKDNGDGATTTDPTPNNSVEDNRSDENVTKACQTILSSLSDDEKETAARISYRYLASRTTTPSSTDGRDQIVLAVAKRYLVAEKYDPTNVLTRLRSTLAYRQKIKIDDLRQCFTKNTTADRGTYRSAVLKEVTPGNMFVRGYDKQNRAILTIVPRKNDPSTGLSPSSFLFANMYLLERALACTERASGGEREEVIVAFDFDGFTAQKAPAVALAVELVTVLKDHFPETLAGVYLCDAPLVLRAFWRLVRPFVDAVTVSKVQFLTGEVQKEEVLGDLIDVEQAMPFLRQGGKMVDPIDVEVFVNDLPFDHAYGEQVL